MENRWISITEGMPKSGIRVLTCDGFGKIDSMFEGTKEEIKAWQPLPRPYKEKP